MIHIPKTYGSKTQFLSYFDQFVGNHRWREKIGCNKFGLAKHYSVVGKYEEDSVNVFEHGKDIESSVSQNGEDLVLNHIFKTIGSMHNYYVEFGAADGKFASNTYFFREMLGWSGLLLEGDLKKVESVDCEKLNLHHEWVTQENINGLFTKYQVPPKFDLLSIDIDSHDYHVWKGLTDFHPRVVIVETHPGLPNDRPLIYPATQKPSVNHGHFGANLLAFYRLAKKKGYEFVTTVRYNAIFVRHDEFEKLNIDPISEEECIKRYFKPNNYWLSVMLKHYYKRVLWDTTL